MPNEQIVLADLHGLFSLFFGMVGCVVVLGLCKLAIAHTGGWPKVTAFRGALDSKFRDALAACSHCRPATQDEDHDGTSLPEDVDKIETALAAALELIQRSRKKEQRAQSKGRMNNDKCIWPDVPMEHNVFNLSVYGDTGVSNVGQADGLTKQDCRENEQNTQPNLDKRPGATASESVQPTDAENPNTEC